MSLLNVSEVLLSPEFMQPVKVYRKYNGRWELGKFVQDEVEITLDMLVCPSSGKDLMKIPEADRIEDTRTFHCLSKLYLSEDSNDVNDQETRTSDVVEWNCQKYKLVSIPDYSDYGYYRAIGVRIRGY